MIPFTNGHGLYLMSISDTIEWSTISKVFIKRQLDLTGHVEIKTRDPFKGISRINYTTCSTIDEITIFYL